MENKNTIYNDDVERIVNEPKRQESIKGRYQKRAAERQKLYLSKTLAVALVVLTIGLMGCVGWINPIFALLVCYFGGFYSAYRLGKYSGIARKARF